AKKILAHELTELVHGREEADKAEEASAALFGGGADSANIPQAVITDDKFMDGRIDIMGVLVAAGMVTSRSEARRAVEQGGVSVNDEKVTDISVSYTKDQIGSGDFLVRKGKKSFKKIVVE
ncbi:MAG: tyrosine--tRNA ligase, partial [Lachnospiraceae bacterium]|nr:tyrosine--tRNA ligase [Lachnospiraceae bacterium]